MHLSICNINIPAPGTPPGIWIFFTFSGQIPLPRVRNAVQMPHMSDPLDGQLSAPPPGHFLGI